jgi:hypothetical protein
MTAGFLNEKVAATAGVIGEMAYTDDGAETWRVTNSMADCRYGMDIVSPAVIWSCGGATHVRRSVDGGRTWQMLAGFGDPRTIRGACHSASFLDENTGWLANSNLFGTTTDGGASWNLRPLPGTANRIATIDITCPVRAICSIKTGYCSIQRMMASTGLKRVILNRNRWNGHRLPTSWLPCAFQMHSTA